MFAHNQRNLRQLRAETEYKPGKVLTEHGYAVLWQVLDRASFNRATGRYEFFEGLDQTAELVGISKSNVQLKLAHFVHVGLLKDLGRRSNGIYKPTKTYEVNVELLAGAEYVHGRTQEEAPSTSASTSRGTSRGTSASTSASTSGNPPEPYAEPISSRNPNPNRNENPNPLQLAERFGWTQPGPAASSTGGAKSKSTEPWPEREESVFQEVLKLESRGTQIQRPGGFEQHLRADYWPIITRLCVEHANAFVRDPEYAHRGIADRAYEERQRNRKRPA